MMNALRRAIHTGAHVHASSHATAERLRTHFPDASITVIHLGAPAFVDARAGSIDGLPDDGPVILSIGTLERRKNLPFLVSLMNDVIGKVPAARLVIAGGEQADRGRPASQLLRVGEVREAAAPRQAVGAAGDAGEATWRAARARTGSPRRLGSGRGRA